METESDKVLRRLAVRFDSALARDEERGAADLARSLAAGRDRHSLIAGGAQVIVPTGPALVGELGLDYCLTADGSTWMIPLDAAEVLVVPGVRPRERDARLVAVLRRLARRAPEVDLFLASGRRRGVLVGAGPDHIRLTSLVGELALPLGSLRAIRFVRGD